MTVYGIIPYMLVKCGECHKNFKTKLSLVKKGWGKYCSRDCYTKAMPRTKNPGRFKIGHKKQGKNERNSNWRGDDVGYTALHAWVRRRLEKPKLCQECKINVAIDLANISQKYKRDLDDWEWLCRKCHMIKDGRLNTLLKNQAKRAEKIKGTRKKCTKCGELQHARGLCHKHYQGLFYKTHKNGKKMSEL